MKEEKGAFIPYFVFYLKDITALEEGCVSFLDENNKQKTINWNKFSMLATVFDEIRRIQQHNYKIEPDFGLQTWLRNMKVFAEPVLIKVSQTIESESLPSSSKSVDDSLFTLKKRRHSDS